MPKLTCGPAFYKRKVWVYNFNVHDCGKNKGHCFLWNETIAARGSEEITSCLLHYFEKNDIRGNTLVAISDNCCGQNKNWNMVLFWQRLILMGRFKVVEHHFPVSGHTMLPSDRDFATIENYTRRQVPEVFSPGQWADVIKKCGKKNPFHVYEMSRHDFYKISNLKESFVLRNKTIAGQAVNLRDVCRLKIEADNPTSVFVSRNFCNDVWEEISLRKRGRPSSLQELQLKYHESRPVDKNKVSDVLSLLQFIPPIHHTFFISLKPTGLNNTQSDNQDC